MGKVLNTVFGSERARQVIGLLIATGLVSAVLGFAARGAEWLPAAQTGLLLVFFLGAVLIIVSPGQRPRVIAISAPAIGAVILGLTVLSEFFLVTVGAAAGWLVAGSFLFRQQDNPQVMQAIRHMRKGRYEEAIESMDAAIKLDKENPEHYRLRAMVFRLDGRLGRARRDYETMLKFAPDGDAGDTLRAEAYDGLAEVHLQAGRYKEADAAASQAHELFPENWVPLYNLGLINDRLKKPQQTVDYIEEALDLRIPDQRQRVLAYVYLARAYTRLGDDDRAAEQVENMAALWKGLEGLQKLIADEQSAPLAEVIAEDVETARLLMIDELMAADLA
ncbi:MAG: tetratricopeptide repeat protein [Chloroflexota bacterium]